MEMTGSDQSTMLEVGFDLKELYDDIEEYLESERHISGPQKLQSMALEVTSTQNEIMVSLVEEAKKFIVPERRIEFSLQAQLVSLNSSINLVETLSKLVSSQSSEAWAKVQRKSHELRSAYEKAKRRITLLVPASEQEFEATVWWMAERGMEEDLDLIRQVKQAPPYSSDPLLQLLEEVEERIVRRVYDFDYVLARGEEAFERNEVEWTRRYAGQYIAIHRGEVIDADRDKGLLTQRLLDAQDVSGPFRAYIIELPEQGTTSPDR